MRHPTEGTLRRLVDEPAGVSDLDREHVGQCSQCLTTVAAVQHDAAAVGDALAVPLDTDVDAGWRRLASSLSSGTPVSKAVTGHSGRWRRRLRSPLVAGVGVAALLAGGGVAAAGDWLQVFKAEHVAPVTISEDDLVSLPDLAGYGEVKVVDPVEFHDVASEAAAEKATGLDAPRIADLPPGVAGQPRIEVVDKVTGTFTFSVAKAQATAESQGQELPVPPDGLDGSTFRLEAGPGIAEVWSEQRGIPALLVARAVAPTAYSSDVSFDTARDYLLSLPGLPEDVAAQLRGFSADGSTLPIPVHRDLMTSRAVKVDGVDATLIQAKNGSMAGVVWVTDGVVTAVAGSLDDDEVLAVARGLG